MGKTINTQLDDGLFTFTFSNSKGEVFSSFLMNPTDINIAVRCEEAADYFAAREKEASGVMGAAQMAKLNAELEEKLVYVLGYDARPTLFKAPMTATTILPTGDLFAVVILETIKKAVEPEIRKRGERMQKAAAKYTDKYERV